MFCNYVAGNIKIIPEEVKEWSYVVKAHFNDDDVSKNLIVKGSSVIPKLSINATHFNFPACGIRSKFVKILKVDNLSDREVSVLLEKSQNFSFSPNRFQLGKDEIK